MSWKTSDIEKEKMEQYRLTIQHLNAKIDALTKPMREEQHYEQWYREYVRKAQMRERIREKVDAELGFTAAKEKE